MRIQLPRINIKVYVYECTLLSGSFIKSQSTFNELCRYPKYFKKNIDNIRKFQE